MKWRDENAVQEALRAVTIAPPSALDEAIYRAAIVGAEFREIAAAADLAISTVHTRAIRYRERSRA